MATVQYTSISNSSYLGKANALPFLLNSCQTFLPWTMGEIWSMVRFVEVGRLACYRLDYGLWRMCVLCLLKGWQANLHNTILPLYNNEFPICCIGVVGEGHCPQTVMGRVSSIKQVTSICDLWQCFSPFVRPRPGKFIFCKTRARSQQIYM